MAQLADLRKRIDAIDSQLVALLGQRAACIREAVDIKQREQLPARIPVRVEEVVANVKALAESQNVDPALAEQLWRAIIEWSIAFEESKLGRT
jgi:isochorismate pyruvate lyase